MDKFIKLTQRQIDKANVHGCGLLALQFNAAIERIAELEAQLKEREWISVKAGTPFRIHSNMRKGGKGESE